MQSFKNWEEISLKYSRNLRGLGSEDISNCDNNYINNFGKFTGYIDNITNRAAELFC